MNIHELDSYDLGDAVKFNDKLNPRIWGADERMRPEVREQLLRIADDFREFLGIDVEIKDITVSGSNAAYTYTPHSDIDLHLVVDLPQADASDVYRELFDAKKYAYNDLHDIKIGGYDVELYVQDANKPHISQGIYSIINNDWVSVPKRRRPDVDDISVRSKFEDLGHRIEQAVKSGDYKQITALAEKIKEMRQAGLDAHGEFGPENLAFKILRTQGLIKKLYDARNEAKDKFLSLDERKRKKKKKSVKYGYGGYWYPGTAYAGQDHPAGTEGGDGGGGDGGGESIKEDAGMTWDGVNPTTDMFTSEDATMTWDGVNPSTAMFTTETRDKKEEDILREFIKFCVSKLGIEDMPRVRLRRDPEWPKRNKTFGRYNDAAKTLEVAWGQRHIMDVLRTVAHELTHKHQHEREQVPADAGETGSEYENEANARAGILMRDWARLHPEHFDHGQVQDLEEDAVKESIEFNWSDYHELPTESIMAIAETFFTKNKNLLESNSPQTASYFADLSNLGQRPRVGSIYLMTLLLLVNDRIQVAQAPTKVKVVKQLGPEAYTVKMPDGTLANFPYDIVKNNIAYHTFFFDNKSQYEKLKLAIKLKFDTELKESASGYIPTKAQAKDPRYSMALTVDIRPGQVGKEANKLKLRTDRQGHPQIARANGLFEELMLEYQLSKEAIQAPVSKEKKEEQEYLRFIMAKVNTGRLLNRHEEKFLKDYQLKRKLAETAQSESEAQHGWRAELVDEINDTTYEVLLTNSRSRESANFVVRPVDMIRSGVSGPLAIDSMDIKDLQTGETRSIQSDSAAPWVYILDAVDALFYDTPALQQRLKAQLQAHDKKGLPLLPGLKQRQSAGQGMAAKDFVAGQDAIARAQGKQLDEDDLDEVKMSPSALEKFATSDAAKGIRAGFEAELIFRDTQGESDEMDPEPDYDADERCYSIQQVIEFFEQDEYGYGMTDRERNRLEEQLDETYMNWRDEQITSDFRNEAEDLIRDVLLAETPMSERIGMYLTDSMQKSDEEADRIVAAGADAPKFTKSEDQEAYAAENPDYAAYLEAAEGAEAELEESVDDSVRQEDGYWDEALDDYRDNYDADDSGFFSDVGLRWMSDVANEFGLDWPVWNMDSRGNDGSRDWDEIGSSLQDAVDMPVKVSTGYHTAARREGTWIIEPDGSLDPDDKSEEMGLEIVSPPMPLLTAIEKLKTVVDWANDPSGGNAYTNSSTGLHMGVSLPRIQAEDDNDAAGIDYVKLILFMGDKYVQQQFGRSANTYCASALDKLKQNIKGGRSDPAGVVELLRHGLTELAYKELQKGVGTSKYTSAHLQDGYVEFRSPGGDWLAKGDEEIGILENTMLRFARAMAIAGDPSAERQEYAKKLYKLVTQDNEQYADQLRLFSEFSAGTISKEQLKKQWADTVLQKELPGTGKNEYEVYSRDNENSPDAVVGTLYAQDYDSAYDLFLRQYGRDINNLNVRVKQPWFDVFDEAGRTVKTIRARDIDTATDRAQYEFGERWTDAWRVYRRPDDTPEPKVSPRAQVAKRIVKKPQGPTQYNYEVVDRKTGKVVDRFYAERESTADAVYNRWLEIKNLPNDTEDYGYRKSAQAADDQRDSVNIQRRLGVQDVNTDIAQNFEPRRQNYELVSDEDPDRVVHRMNNATADEVRAWIAQQEQSGMPAGFLRTRIVAETIDPVSGAGAVPPRPIVIKKSQKAVTPVEPVVKGLPYRSAIGQAISKKDLENMTQQIQMARQLGDDVNENFADGKVKGKSRPGRVKRAGASCAGSVTDLRARAKKYGGERGKMYHWCANMKSGRKK
jgi:hypothetical protein